MDPVKEILQLWDYQIAGICIFALSLFGFICNLLVIVFIRRIPSLANAFGKLVLSQAIADCTHQAVFAFFTSAVVFLRADVGYGTTAVFGHILISAYEVTGLSHLCISFNRFSALHFPIAYSRMFTYRNTVFLIIFCWILALGPTFYVFTQIDCSFYLPTHTWIWIYKLTPACKPVQWYMDFVKYVSYVVIVASLDFLTIIRIHMTNKQVNAERTVQSRRRRQEVMLVWQACLQGIFFISELITYFWLSNVFTAKWTLFCLTTVSWIMVHAMDGAIVLIFNRDFRRLIFHFPRCKRQLPSAATVSNITNTQAFQAQRVVEDSTTNNKNLHAN